VTPTACTVTLAALLASMGGCSSRHLPPQGELSDRPVAAGQQDDDVEIPLDQVPEIVRRAALAAVPGIVLEEASLEIEDGVEVYELEGEADGVKYEIEVTADGEVLEIEQDDGDDGEDDDD
jgi:hypothetical protein